MGRKYTPDQCRHNVRAVGRALRRWFAVLTEPDETAPPQNCTRVHGTAISFENNGVLLLGPSGSGKSSLGLQLLALGAVLIADDQVDVVQHEDAIYLRRPEALPPYIEARGVGLLRAEMLDQAPLSLIVDMGQQEKSRLPKRSFQEFSGHQVPLIKKVDAPYFSYAILHYIKWGDAD